MEVKEEAPPASHAPAASGSPTSVPAKDDAAPKRRSRSKERRGSRSRSRSRDRKDSRKHRSRSRSRDRRRSRSRSAEKKRGKRSRSRSRSPRRHGGDRDRRRDRSRSRSRDRRRDSDRGAPRRGGYASSGDWYGNSKRPGGGRDMAYSPPRADLSEVDRLEEKRRREAAEVTRDARTVFVSSLVVRATEDDVRDFFTAVGRVNDVQLIKDKSGRSKGFGYVEFEALESVPAALLLNGASFCMKHKGCTCSGLPVNVKPSEAEKNYEAAALSSVAQLSTRIYVGNVPEGTTQQELKEEFSRAGEVVDVIFPRNLEREARTFVFVQYKERGIL